ncbi:MAG: dodecin family protein [Thermaerobacter sp.]|nr:dodecin family protein [Thermaerobacter sp.]
MGHIAKIMELVGDSPTSWQDAVENAVREANRTIDNITGVEVTNWTARVAKGQVVDYKVDVKIAVGVQPDR